MGPGVPWALNVISISLPPSQPSLQSSGSLSSLRERVVLGTDYILLGLQITRSLSLRIQRPKILQLKKRAFLSVLLFSVQIS